MSFIGRKAATVFDYCYPFRDYVPASMDALNVYFGYCSELGELGVKRDYYQTYYEDKKKELADFFVEQEFDVADALFDILLELKKGKMRKNGYIPDYGHEIDQLLPVMNIIRSFSPEERSEIEDMHGSMERWVCAIIAHDLGEDFNLFYADLNDLLLNKLGAKGVVISDQHRDIVDNACKSMECLTHYRKFTYAEVKALLGDDVELPKVKNGEVIPLDELKDAFWEKMDVLKQDNQHLQVFANWHHNRNEPVIQVTRYGATPHYLHETQQDYRAEWNIYIQKIVSDDLYDALTKVGDRVNGVATRPAMNARNPEAFDTYLDETDHIINRIGVANMISKSYYPDSPLASKAHELAATLALLERLARIFIDHDPLKNSPGKRGMSVFNLAVNRKEMGCSPIFLSEFFPDCLSYYEGVPSESHPIGMMMRDLREIRRPYFDMVHEVLYRELEKALCEIDADEMAEIIDSGTIISHADDWEPEDYRGHNL